MLTAALAAVSSRTRGLSDECDVVELNRFYNDDAQPIFFQLIGWDFERDGKEHVAFWRMNTNPRTDRVVGGGYRSTFFDDSVGKVVVYSQSYRETHTQHDPELQDRSFRAKEARRGIRGRFR